MKREFAATIFSMLLAGTALAGSIERSDLPPPAQSETPDAAQLRNLVDSTLNERHPAAPSADDAHEDWSIYSSAELWLEGIPEPENISLDALAMKQKRYPSYGEVRERKRAIPTAYTWNYGNWNANVGTSITTASPSSSLIPGLLHPDVTDPSGGAGTIRGRVEYDINSWQFYGGTKRELVANPDGTIGVKHNFSGGTYYSLPQSVIGGKIGTGFEVNPVGDAKTRLEYRKMFGTTEGFLAAERSMPFQQVGTDVTGVNGLKAGINRKF